MTSKRNFFVWGSLAALTLAALACSPALPGSNAGPTPTIYMIPTTSPDQLATLNAMAAGGTSDGSGESGEISEEPVEGGEKLNYQGIDTSTLSSYHSVFTMTWDGTDADGNPVSGTYTVETAHSSDPPANLTKWSSNDVQSGASAFEMIQIGEATFIIGADGSGTPQPCITTSTEGSTPEQAPPYSPDTWMMSSDLSNAQRILPDETVNGVSAQHYRITEAEVAGFAGMTDYELNVWIEPDGNYPVKQTLVADGTLLFGSGASGHMEWTYDLTDINGPVNITQPEGCEAPAGSDFPRMPDAAEVSTFGTVLTYTTPSAIADVVAFYNAQLPGLGWVAGTASTDTPGMASMEFTRGEEKASILITESDGKTSVFVTFE